MKNKTRFLLPLLMLCTTAMPVTAHAEADDLVELQQKLGDEWRLIKSDRRQNIKSWVKQEDGKAYRSFKVEATLQGTVASFVRTVLDVENYHKWYWEVIKARTLRKLSPTDYHIYVHHRAPHGVPDRDVTILLHIDAQTAGNSSLTVTVKALQKILPPTAGLVRMQAEDLTIRVTPVGPNTLHIESEGYIDPGGKVPNWAINFVQRSAPYSNMVGLQRMMKADSGKHATPLPFPISEFYE